MAQTFYWHDYETFGADPSRDRPVQFAGLRTDENLNVVGEPLVLFARPSNEILPQPGACLVTGITPQQALAEGVSEAEFITRIHAELSQPDTCSVGYNSIRFDDEVTRYTLYRNFFDPYAREWREGNSRWDIIDLLRTAWALRPEGIEWPLDNEGLPSFRLEKLTAANGIAHEDAHDALSDVHATIAMARLVRDKQPKLFQHVFDNRDKKAAAAMLDVKAMKPVLHVSGMFGARRHNIALVVPLARRSSSPNEVICADLSADPRLIAEQSVEQIREALFTPASDLPDGTERPGLKTVRLNRCPVLLTPKLLDSKAAARLGIDGSVCREHLAALRGAADLGAKVEAVFADREYAPITDPDRMLYSGGFFSDGDRRLMDRVRESEPAQLGEQTFPFEDKRLPEMLFRYRARNYPDTLSSDEQAQWEEYRFQHLTDPAAGGSICLEKYHQEIEQRLQDGALSQRDRDLLLQLQQYGDQLLA